MVSERARPILPYNPDGEKEKAMVVRVLRELRSAGYEAALSDASEEDQDEEEDEVGWIKLDPGLKAAKRPGFNP